MYGVDLKIFFIQVDSKTLGYGTITMVGIMSQTAGFLVLPGGWILLILSQSL